MGASVFETLDTVMLTVSKLNFGVWLSQQISVMDISGNGGTAPFGLKSHEWLGAVRKRTRQKSPGHWWQGQPGGCLG